MVHRSLNFSDMIAIFCRMYAKDGLRSAGADPLKRRFDEMTTDEKTGELKETIEEQTSTKKEKKSGGGCPIRWNNLGFTSFNEFGMGDIAIISIIVLVIFSSLMYGSSDEATSCPAGYEKPEELFSMLNPFTWGQAPAPPQAVTIFKDATIWTRGEPEFCEAMGVDGSGLVVRVGSLEDVMTSAVTSPSVIGMEGQFIFSGGHLLDADHAPINGVGEETFLESQGVLIPGSNADFVVLSGSPMDREASETGPVKLLSTFSGGVCKW
eukprot:CAMPEP_0196579976 /NCGR_PEP_ID=MMETSP1081-20130531/26034_1 /TAXON_ID=36882 /ORGANISM="Pyramimonas amylifera, Strain CCMP720" /LENGTH=265 /DNA_ID=CAMNT_0041899715 /DNA_START=45 /DNA_END=839 /DNA_ORIENTATION=-